MTQQRPARLLDLSRLMSRAGRVPTGIDRVEFAYLRALIRQDDVPVFGIGRTALGYVLLDRAGMAGFARHVQAGQWPVPDLVSRMNWRLTPAMRLGQSAGRRLAHAAARAGKLRALLAQAFPAGFTYYNVGHSNLTEQMLSAVRITGGSRIVVMVHDTIPLDFPQFQRPGTPEAFGARLQRVAVHADKVICTSIACLKDVNRHMSGMGRVPPLVPALLGVDVLQSGQPEVRNRPYFVTVGTIEPRKNHALLLDIWESFAGAGPELVICGSRGWQNDAVFARLDRGIPGVHEVNDADDERMASLLTGSRGLLFPSLAEGFGLPPAEAAALGVPVVCSDLPSCREVLGKHADFLDAHDKQGWQSAIARLSAAERTQVVPEFRPPDWQTHFKIAFTVT